MSIHFFDLDLGAEMQDVLLAMAREQRQGMSTALRHLARLPVDRWRPSEFRYATALIGGDDCKKAEHPNLWDRIKHHDHGRGVAGFVRNDWACANSEGLHLCVKSGEHDSWNPRHLADRLGKVGKGSLIRYDDIDHDLIHVDAKLAKYFQPFVMSNPYLDKNNLQEYFDSLADACVADESVEVKEAVGRALAGGLAYRVDVSMCDDAFRASIRFPYSPEMVDFIKSRFNDARFDGDGPRWIVQVRDREEYDVLSGIAEQSLLPFLVEWHMRDEERRKFAAGLPDAVQMEEQRREERRAMPDDCCVTPMGEFYRFEFPYRQNWVDAIRSISPQERIFNNDEKYWMISLAGVEELVANAKKYDLPDMFIARLKKEILTNHDPESHEDDRSGGDGFMGGPASSEFDEADESTAAPRRAMSSGGPGM